ncbi:MAG TPA: CDP-alcohol phosphatidyltransferase family protein [Candidatus Saccharimonadales bacterium]|nr:CDP-alcohol phosphatidyltransferase family protein [Candidatus Saccharimonadales bacterium]
MPEQRNVFQKVSDATGGVITPANVMDAGAMALAVWAAPQLNTRKGIKGIAVSFGADVLDGFVAGMTGTRTEFGSTIDRAGDKVKSAVTAPYIYKYRLAPRALLGAVVLQNAANMGAAVYDFFHNETRQIVVEDRDRHAALANNVGLGLHLVGGELARDGYYREEKAARIMGNLIGWGGLATLGRRTSLKYWQQASSIYR